MRFPVFRIALAICALWIAGLTLYTAGELVQALPTQILTEIRPPLPWERDWSGSHDRSGFVPDKRAVMWGRVLFLAIAPPVLAVAAAFAFRWALVTPQTPILDGVAKVTHTRAPFIKATIAVLRLLRGIFYVGATWQVFTLLPALGWLANVDQINGGMLAQFFVKVAALLLFALLTYLLRRAIDWLHTRAFGSPHPALAARRFAL